VSDINGFHQQEKRRGSPQTYGALDDGTAERAAVKGQNNIVSRYKFTAANKRS
jgi:hypothetical protein